MYSAREVHLSPKYFRRSLESYYVVIEFFKTVATVTQNNSFLIISGENS